MGHVGNLNLRLIAFGLNIDGNQAAVIIRDDAASPRIGTRHHRIGKLRFVEAGDLVDGIGALRTERRRVNSTKGCGSRAVFQDFCARVKLHSEIACRLVRIFRCLD